MKQRMIVNKVSHFDNEVNRFLREGWRVVSGTIGGSSFRRLTNQFDDYSIGKHGETFDHLMWCVLERDDGVASE